MRTSRTTALEGERVFEVWCQHPDETKFSATRDPDDNENVWHGTPGGAFFVMMHWQREFPAYRYEIREFIVVPAQWGESEPSKWWLRHTSQDGVQHLERLYESQP